MKIKSSSVVSVTRPVFLAAASLVFFLFSVGAAAAQDTAAKDDGATKDAVAQDNDADKITEKMKKKQSKMMETQFLMTQLMQLRHNSQLRTEIDVVDDQVEELKAMAQAYQKEIMQFAIESQDLQAKLEKLMKEGKHEEAKELGQDLQNKYVELSEKYMGQAEEVLMPHQIERLSQISKQQRVKLTNKFSDEFGIALSLADEIGLTKAEKEKLTETIKEARKKYYKEAEALKKRTNDEIMGALTLEQQEKIREILGDTFDQEKSRRLMLKKLRTKNQKVEQQ